MPIGQVYSHWIIMSPWTFGLKILAPWPRVDAFTHVRRYTACGRGHGDTAVLLILLSLPG